jgi:hypothetical protein
MKSTCANCGEELLGAVNTCWRCGATVFSTEKPQASATLAPDRPQPTDAEIVEAELAASPGDESLNDQSPADGSLAGGSPDRDGSDFAGHAPNGRSAQEAAVVVNAPAVDSAQRQFRAENLSTQDGPAAVAAPDVRSIPPPTHYARYAAATGGAVGALVLAVMSLAFAYFTIGAMFTALLGIGMGAWGIQSNHRKMAIIAMALCCLAVVLSACFGAVNLYTEINGHSPFESPPLLEPEIEPY